VKFPALSHAKARRVEVETRLFYNLRMTTVPYTSDTSEEALQIQLECFRRMTPQERIEKMSAWSTQLKTMAFAAIRRQHPDYDQHQVQVKYIELAYGSELAQGFQAWLAGRASE
jgi:hypothetical protein